MWLSSLEARSGEEKTAYKTEVLINISGEQQYVPINHQVFGLQLLQR